MILVLTILLAATSSGGSPDTGELKIEGTHIVRLVLQGPLYPDQELSNPSGTVTLRVGAYRTREIELEGGYSHRPQRLRPKRITISPNTPAVLTVGGPLRQTLRVDRCARVLTLTYALVGIGNERYEPALASMSLPTFTVYRGGRVIASGRFERSSGFSYRWHVPRMTFGPLTIIPSADIGPLGKHEGQAVTWDWDWHDNVPNLLLWFALLIAAALPKANHDRRVLLVFIPLLFMNFSYAVIKELAIWPSLEDAYIDTFFRSWTAGFTMLWLLAGYLANRPRIVQSLASLCLIVGMVPLAMLLVGSFATEEIVITSLLLVFVAIVALIAVARAGWRCYHIWRPRRFLVWLGLNEVGFALACVLLFGLILMPGGPSVVELLPVSFVIGALVGLSLYALTLPFAILGVVSPFFRDRMCQCLNLYVVRRPLSA